MIQRLGLKISAVLLAVLLWAIVNGRQPTQGYVDVEVRPALDSSLVLLGQPPTVRALVTGRAVELVKLRADPPNIHRIVDADAPDTLVLDITPSDVRLPADLEADVKVVDVQPRSVTLRFETRATRRVRVVSGGRILLRDGATISAADSADFEPSFVLISGPRQLVRRIDHVNPFSLSLMRGDTLQHVADLDTTGKGVRMQPQQVRVVLRTGRGGAR